MQDYKNLKEPEVMTFNDGLVTALFLLVTFGSWLLINLDFLS